MSKGYERRLQPNGSENPKYIDLLEEDKPEQPLSTTKSEKVTLEVHEDTEAMREEAKQEVTEETDGWSKFWKNEYDKQKDGDKVDEF